MGSRGRGKRKRGKRERLDITRSKTRGQLESAEKGDE
jgi:hypothetical protein